jgi:hypothetical protein
MSFPTLSPAQEATSPPKGFQGFLCEITGAPVIPEACLACARSGAPGCSMTAPVMAGILANQRPDSFGPTVSVLLGCARKARLKRSHPYWLKPSELWWAYRGQLMHNVAAAYTKADGQALAEQRFSIPVNVSGELVEISGQPDLVLLDRRHLVDYKTTKRMPQPWKRYTCPTTGKVIQEGQGPARTKHLACPHCGERHVAREILLTELPKPYGSHVQQISLYRLLLAENGIRVDSGEIVYQDMEGQLRLPVDLLALDAAEALLEARAGLYFQPDLPEVLTHPADRWECDYCPVRTACETQHGGPVGRATTEVERELA